MRRPSPGLVVALLALFVALDGPAAAARVAQVVSGSKIRNNSVTGQKIRNGTLGYQDLSAQARKLLKTPGNRSVTRSKLATGAVGPDAITAGAIRTEELAVGAVDRARVADNAIDSTKVADGSLFARDVASAFGQATLDFPSLAPGQCVGLPVQVPGGVQVADDVVAVTPPSNWPPLVPVTPSLGPADNTFTLTACNGSGAATADPGPVNFRYVVLNM